MPSRLLDGVPGNVASTVCRWHRKRIKADEDAPRRAIDGPLSANYLAEPAHVVLP